MILVPLCGRAETAVSESDEINQFFDNDVEAEVDGSMTIKNSGMHMMILIHDYFKK